MLRIFGGAALAATLVFFWGFLFWTVLPVGSTVQNRNPQKLSLIHI